MSNASDSCLSISSHVLSGCQPRITCAFINKRSGAKLGNKLLKILGRMDSVQCVVHNLDEEDPVELIHKYMLDWANLNLGLHAEDKLKGTADHGQSLPVMMACGGDGTFNWIASTAVKCAHRILSNPELEKIENKDNIIKYAIIPFPLGTGNDMSGVLGWGRNLKCDDKSILKLLQAVELSCSGPKCDVWGVNFTRFKSMSRFHAMCNYFSIGADAKATRLFERHRTSKPRLYRSQSFNKASYAAFGGFLALKGSASLGKRIKSLVVDGKEIRVPPKAKALVILNIPSYADGTRPWNVKKSHPTFHEAAINDGIAEVFCLRSLLSIALFKLVGGVFSSGIKKLAQGKNISINMHPMEVWAKKTDTSSTLYAQVDGEAFEFDSSGECIEVFRKGSVPTMFGPLRGSKFQGPPARLKSGGYNYPGNEQQASGSHGSSRKGSGYYPIDEH